MIQIEKMLQICIGCAETIHCSITADLPHHHTLNCFGSSAAWITIVSTVVSEEASGRFFCRVIVCNYC